MPPYLGGGGDARHKNDPKVSGIKTNSTPGGKGYNEIRFDDNAGREQLFLHAQNSLDVRVNGSSQTSVGGSYHLTVGGEKDGKTHGDLRQKVFHDQEVQILGDEVHLVGRSQLQQVKGVAIHHYEAGHFEHVKGRFTLQCSDGVVYLDAATEIQLSVKDNFIKITPAGILINGLTTKINCPGDKAQLTPVSPGGSVGKLDDPAGADGSVSGYKSAPQAPPARK
jgi:type VI secretion system secreted protein VgrG